MNQMKPRRKLVTAEMLWAMPDNGGRCELVEGELVEMAPATGGHGRRAMDLMAMLTWWVKQHKLGATFAADTGFVLSRDPDTVLAPDGAFIAAERMPDPEPSGFWAIVPDLVLEVVSPGDRRGQVLAKVGAYLDAGVKVVCVLWPGERQLAAYRGVLDCTVLGEADRLTCEELLPGFALPLAEVFR